MLFNSYEFIFIFLPLTLAGAAILGWIRQKAGGLDRENLWKVFLTAISLVFYGWNDLRGIPVLLASMAINYALGRRLEQEKRRKAYLCAGLCFDLGLLIFFKYTDPSVKAPLGISFFTFTQIAYLMECYRRNLAGVGLTEYGAYVSFFPKMMQGPIALPGEMLSQLRKCKSRETQTWERIYRCLYLFVLGLFKKVMVADTLGRAVDFGYASLGALNAGDALIVMLSYTLQLYFDFSGYCDMAMGIAGVFGIELPLNFDSPYKASNIMEFWERWHMTLTRFFTRYLYIPLGGNRKGKARTYLNCLIVFLLSGIWHGAGVQFVVWGLMHGVLYVLTRWWKDRQEKLQEGQAGEFAARMKRPLGTILTFLYVNAAWVFFRAPSLQDATTLFKTMGSLKFGRINWNLAGCFHLDEFWYVIKVLHLDRWQYAHYIIMTLFLLIVLLAVFWGKTAAAYVKKVKPGIAHSILLAILFVWSVLSFSEVSSFLYVNF